MTKKVMLVVEFEIKPEHRDKFLTIMHGHASRTARRESECLQFDVLLPDDEPHKVFLVEGYTSREALDDHMENSGLKFVRETYKDWIVSRTITICDVLA
ncbi:putative quinol monooxygenase [Bordetella sp. BOR01]|uniref:putative quinol monooxygenase n=1 Tax=Bordetella sp. BOR01 TaxID=2854779 RepID=UPI001C4648C1|nr:antibiotic biosynthesis monooxygenase [Bordetella sp. BOR01]MBV7485050.1 antibiotic biosynthesis monooxygenase [Bordetella sp. BOR01]